ncbi:MAG: hypothetical protein H0X03_02575 [Nitrosopumilus sp.]|nr:hypothetical protein [Nitrosopumilus sp.]
MVHRETTSSLERFRKCIINNRFRSLILEKYNKYSNIFPIREGGFGEAYLRAIDKTSLKKLRAITFVNAKEILGILLCLKNRNNKIL